MKKNRNLVVIIILILIYFCISFFETNKNYIIINNAIYQINNKNLKIIDNNKLDNKKIKIYKKDGKIVDAYYKNANYENMGSFVYDKDKNIINTNSYYYGYYGNIKVSKFEANEYLTNASKDAITSLLNNTSDISNLNYISDVKYDDGEIIIIGNFDNNNFYSYSEEKLNQIECFEYIIKKDKNNNYKLLYSINKRGIDIINQKYFKFSSLIKIDNAYYINFNIIDYSFFDGNGSSIYKIEENSIKEIKG